MFLFIPRSLCALKRVAAKGDHPRFSATQGIRIAEACGMYRAEATDGRRAVVVQGMVPTEEPPWPAFKELPDDAFEAIILPKDLERACKIGDDYLQNKFGVVGVATMGNEICLGLGADVVTARIVEGKFPPIDQVIPRKRPLFTFSVDPRLLGETLLAIADMLPDENRSVQCFFYGNGAPLGICARNNDNGMFIDALVVPLAPPNAKPAEAKPEANGQASGAPTAEPAKQDDPPAPDATPQDEAKGKKAKKVKA
jgi:hypothetical protein